MFGITGNSSRNCYGKLEENSEDLTGLSNSLSSSAPTNSNEAHFNKRQLEQTTQLFSYDQENNVEIASQSKKHKFSHFSSTSVSDMQSALTPGVINSRKRKTSEEAMKLSGQVIKKSAIVANTIISNGEVVKPQDVSDEERSSLAKNKTIADENQTAKQYTLKKANLSSNASLRPHESLTSLNIGFLSTLSTKAKDTLSRMPSRLSQQINWYNITKIFSPSQNHIDVTHKALSHALGDDIIKIILDYDEDKCNYIVKTLLEEFSISDFVRKVANSATVLKLSDPSREIENIDRILNVFNRVEVLNASAEMQKKVLKNIAKLTNLRELNFFGYSDIAESNIADLNTSTKLEKIGPLYGITNESLAQLVNYHPNLKSVELHLSNMLTDTSSLLSLNALEYLALVCSWFSQISSLVVPPNLKSLRLCITKNLDLSFLLNLNDLEYLDLSDCNDITDFRQLSDIVKLKSLTLHGCRQITDISFLSNLTELEDLDLSDCSGITDFSPLKDLVKLKSVKLQGCQQITDINFLSNLKDLEYLDLSHCRGIIFSQLSGLINLKSLKLEDCDVQDISFLSNLKNLESLDLSRCRVTDCSKLGDLVKLKSLKLHGYWSITEISFLSNLKNLEYLDLSDCKIAAKCYQLESLIGSLEKLKSHKVNWHSILRDEFSQLRAQLGAYNITIRIPTL